MQCEHSNQSSFFGVIYEELIPADHLLCKLAAVATFYEPAKMEGRLMQYEQADND